MPKSTKNLNNLKIAPIMQNNNKNLKKQPKMSSTF